MPTFYELLRNWQRADAGAIAYWLSHAPRLSTHQRFIYGQLRDASNTWYGRTLKELERERQSLPLI